MNHIYRLVWCKSLNALVVASELSSRQHGGVSASPRNHKIARLLTVALLGMGGFIYAAGAWAQSTENAKLDDLQSLVSKYDAPVVGAASSGTVQAVAGAPVTVVRQVVSTLPVGGTLSQVGQAVKSTLASVPPIHAGLHASAPALHVHAGARVSPHGLAAGAEVRTGALAGVASRVTGTVAGVPAVGKLVGGVVNNVVAKVPPLRLGGGIAVGTPAVTAPSAMQSLAADRRRYSGQVSSQARALGIADGNGGGLPSQVIDQVVANVAKLPVAGPAVAQVGSALGSVTSGGGDLQGTVGKVVGGVVETTSKLPVAGPVVAQVGSALGSVAAGGGDLQGTVGKVVGGVVETASKLPGAGPVVAQVGSALGSVTSGKQDLGTTLGTVVGGVVNNGAKLPVLGETVASVGQAVKTVTSGGNVSSGLQGQLGQVVGGLVNSLAQQPGVGPVVAKVGQTLQETTAQIGNDPGAGGAIGGELTGVVGKVVGGVAGATSKIPVVGPVVGQVTGVLASATSGGSLTDTVGQVVGGVTAATSQVPVVGPVVAQVGGALTSVTSGGSDASGLLGNVLGTVTGATSQVPVLGSVVSQVGGALGSVTSGGTGLGQVTGLLPLGSAGGALAGGPGTVAPMATSAVSPMAAPVVPPPSATPTGLIIGNGGVVGTATQLLGSSESSLFNNSNPGGYISNGSLKVSNANFTQGYSTLNLLGLPVVNSTPVGTVLTTVGGTVLGGTGSNSHLTLIGGVTSGNYISNINNGAAGGLLGLVLPKNAPAWASTCLNVLGVLKEQCWAVNAAQDYQVLVGDGASANGSKEVVIGTNASHTLPTQDASQAFPGSGANDPNNPTGVPTADYAARMGHSVVIGDDASGTANAQTILGAEATASVANSVALGYKSAADRGAQANYSAYGLAAPQNSAGEVSIGAPGAERQITNVAAGSADTDAVNVAQLKSVATTADNAVQYDSTAHTTVTLAGPASTDGGVTGGTTISNLHQGALSATSTDAVNGSQLFATNESLVKYMGGTTNFDPTTNTWTAPTFSVVSIDSAGNSTTGNYDNVTDAFNAVDGSLTSINKRIDNYNDNGSKYFQANSTGTGASAAGTDAVAVGPDSVAAGTASMAMGKGASSSADDALALGSGASASMANSVALGAGSVTTVGALSNYTAYALTTPQNSSGEVNVGNRQITGVAAGSADTDAVNVAQLKAVDEKIDGTDKLAVKYDADSSGNPTNTISLTGDGSGAPVRITNVAIGAESATSTDAVNGSQLWHWTQDTTNQYSNYSLYNDIQNIHPGGGSVKYFSVNSTGPDSSATGADSVAIGPSAKSSGKDSVAMGNGADASADNAVAIGAGSVADRANTVSVGSAGNERQITNVAAGTASTDAVNVGQLNSAIDTTTKGTVRYDTNTDGSIDYSSVTLGGGTGDTTIHNVAAGTAPTDAANVGQVQQAMDWSKNYTDQRFSQVEGDIQRMGHRADAGVAAAMAAAGLPQAYEPGRSMAAVAAGSFRGESSIAVGVSTISEGGRWVYKLSGSANTRGDTGVSIGAGMQW